MSDTESPFPNAATPAIRELLVAVTAFVAEAKPPLTLTSLSSILFGSGGQIERLETGADITTGRLRAAWTRLRELEAGGPRTRSKPRKQTEGASNGEHAEETRRN